MPSCVVRGCETYSKKDNKSDGVTFHRFLRPGHEKRERWIKFVQKTRKEDTWLPTKHSYICSKHFKIEDKYLTKTGRVYLKKSAIPYFIQFQISPSSPYRSESSISEPLSDSESIFDTPRKVLLKRKLSTESIAKKNIADKIKKIQRQKRYLKKNVESYKTLVKNLNAEFGFDQAIENDLTIKAENVELLKSELKKNKQNKHAVLYTAPLRKFALTLHYYSPAAYKYVRECYNKALPHPRTIIRWYSTPNAEPGFTVEVFRILKEKCDSNEKPVACSLVFDEMAMRKQKLFHNKQKLGAVNFGAGPMKGEDEDTVASQALVFMLVSLNENWKLPIGYFLIAGITPEIKANLIKMCLEKCHEVGVTVASLTFDGRSKNLKIAEILGCQLSNASDLQTHFLHPCTSEKVCIFIDPCHVMKLIRNAFEKIRLLFDENDNKINWQLLINLNKLQQNERLRFANNLTPRHIHFRNQIMKVKLATQLLSMSVAKALPLCDEVLKSTRFQDSTGTVQFIKLMNNFFDVMNSRKCNFYGFKRPLDTKNTTEVFVLLERVKSYLLKLKCQIESKIIIRRPHQAPRIILNVFKKPVIESSLKTGFLGALICIESLKTLYTSMVADGKLLKYISMDRISQDHLELFFGLIRKHGGYNDNPNVLQFRAAYKKTLNHLELRSSVTGNCIPLDNCTMLHSSSENVINSTTELNRHETYQFQVLPSTPTMRSDIMAERNCEHFAEMLNHENVQEVSRIIVGYISGFVSRALTKTLHCEECVDSLTTEHKLRHHKLINIKDMGGLCYSTEDVYKVCVTTEMIIRHIIRKSGGKELSSTFSFNYITANTLKCFVDKEVFTCLSEHSLHQPATFNHRLHLIRAIINRYTSIRLKYEAKLSNFHITKRQKLTKLVLFEGN